MLVQVSVKILLGPQLSGKILHHEFLIGTLVDS